MLLKSLKLKNIRSYKSLEIPFLTGTTLFEGDIGSGKSTILMAIEFALFGLGSEKAGALLRTGETEGTVSMVFDVDGMHLRRSVYALHWTCTVGVGDFASIREVKSSGIAHLPLPRTPEGCSRSLAEAS